MGRVATAVPSNIIGVIKRTSVPTLTGRSIMVGKNKLTMGIRARTRQGIDNPSMGAGDILGLGGKDASQDKVISRTWPTTGLAIVGGKNKVIVRW